MKAYEEADYARSRLPETIVRLTNGKPIFIQSVLANKVYYNHLGEDEQRVCKLSDLNINPVPLGYVNEGNNAFYLTRSPVREDWRQGLRSRTMRVVGALGGMGFDLDDNSIAKTILGEYPSFKTALKNAEAGAATAFSRNFAILPGRTLQYKGRFECGLINQFGPALHRNMFWVQEELEEELAAA